MKDQMMHKEDSFLDEMDEDFLVSKASEDTFINGTKLRDTDVELDPPQRVTTELLLDNLQFNREKNFFLRNFSPISRGGIRSSVFTLFSGTVGAGVLSLPHVS